MAIILILGVLLLRHGFKDQIVFEKEHIKIINSMIEKSLENKPIFTLSFPSKNYYLWKLKMKFNFILSKKSKLIILNLPVNVFNQLLNIYYNEYTSDKKNK